MVDYIEIGATYQVLVPEDYILLPDCDKDEVKDYKKYWDGKEITILDIYHNIKMVQGTVPDDQLPKGRISFVYYAWLHKMLRHCPQVEHYIQSQKKETYTSPFTGKSV